MSQYHKIWIEVDVEKEPMMKTEKILEIMKVLQKLDCVLNVTKCQYLVSGEKTSQTMDMK